MMMIDDDNDPILNLRVMLLEFFLFTVYYSRLSDNPLANFRDR